MIFIDLRDRSGTVQITVDPDNGAEMFAVAEHLRNETVIQVQGKVRGQLEVPADADRATLEQLALASDVASKWLAGKQPSRVIVVPGKLVNLVP